MFEHILTVIPSRKPGHFGCFLDGELLCTSEMPFFMAARVMLSRGLADPTDWLVMRHVGSHHAALKARVGYAAKWTIEQAPSGRLRRRIYKPRPRGEGAPRIEQTDGGATTLPERSDA